MLFKDPICLSDVTSLSLLTIFILKEAIVELWQAVKDQSFVEVAQYLCIDFSGIAAGCICIFFLYLKHLNFYLLLFQDALNGAIIDDLAISRL